MSAVGSGGGVAEPADPVRPVFVVGPARSGTSLARAVINGHSGIALAGETHYFDDLRPRMAEPDSRRLTEQEHVECQDYFVALSHRPFGHEGDPARGWLDRGVLAARADSLGSTADAYFEAYCRIVAEREDAGRWGDKTPRHVFRISDILTRYPDANAICMIRDPRAVVASYRDWKNDQGGFDIEDDCHRESIERDNERARRTFDPLLMSLMWRSQVRAISAAVARHGSARVRVQRYEDLVTRPEQAVAEIASFLRVPFEPDMLDVPVLNSSYDRFAADGGISVIAAERWRTRLGRREIALVQATCRSQMAAFGYEPQSVGLARWGTPAYWARLPWSVARAAHANRGRVGRLPSYIWRRVRPLWA